MNCFMTIDGGTTNTRAILWKDGKEAARAFRNVGVRNTAIDGNDRRLRETVRDLILELLSGSHTPEEELDRIIASGMITSELGLYELPHITAPAGKEELRAGMKKVLIPDICSAPFCFIPGVKNMSAPADRGSFEAMDIMRGEETESIALIETCQKGKPLLIALPGSHMKFVYADGTGRIRGCLTTISGELLNSIVTDTIIAGTVGRRFITPGEYDREYCLMGFETAFKTGLARALFSGRILHLNGEKNEAKTGSFILGACLESDVRALKQSSALNIEKGTEVVIAGRDPLRQALRDILEADGSFGCVSIYEADGTLPLSAQGARIISGM